MPSQPGLEFHTSNRLEILCDHLQREITAAPLHPLEAELVVVQSQGMQRWLTLQLARRQGIAANLEMPFPVSFCEQLTAADLSTTNQTAGNQTAGRLDREELTWQLFDRLATPDPRLVDYLEDDSDQRKRYQLAARTANRFEDYLLYRPDLIHRWQAGKSSGEHVAWQSQLWRAIPELKAASQRATILADITKLAALVDARHAKDQLPSRVSVFGVSTLAPAVLDLLQVLARRIPVRIYFVSPTYHFWGDLRSEREQARLRRRLQSSELQADTETDLQLDIETGNPLLASLGRQGRDFFNLCQKRDPDGTAWQELEFDDPEPTTALATIQHDILHLIDRSDEDEPQQSLDPSDHSLSVHVCHSPLREMEVIRDQLLARFAADEDLRPHDVLILVPDIYEYGPYVQAVFNGEHRGSPKIPVHLADRDLSQEHPLATAFLQILETAHDRLETSAVLDLLEVPAIRRSFNLETLDLPTLRAWVQATNIRWGLSAEDRESQQAIPPFEANTWRQGLDRLLLGFACGECDDLVLDIAAHGEATTSRSEVLGRFVDFAETLFALLPKLRRTQSSAAWSETLTEVIDKLFAADNRSMDRHSRDHDADEAGRQFLREICLSLAPAKSLIHPSVIREHLARLLQSDSQGTSFLTGRVTVCALKPMRTIPFAVVAIAGLSDGSFPRSDSPLPFDLIAQDPRPGDRSLRDDDRYLFLETLLATRQSLILTYVGRSQKDESESPPSPVLAELLDTIERSFTTDTEVSATDRITTLHPLTAFSPAYYDGENDKLFSYSQDNLDACLAATDSTITSSNFVPQPLTSTTQETLQLDIDDLIRFWTNPSRGFAEGRLELTIPKLSEQTSPAEPFVLDALERYKVQDWLLERRLRDQSDEAADYALAQKRGTLPIKALGRAYHQDSTAIVDSLWAQIEPLQPKATTTVLIRGEDYILSGSIDHLFGGGRVQFRCAKLAAKDRLSAWIRHLALLVSRQDRGLPTDFVTIILASGEEPYHLKSIPDARKVLETLIEGYRCGKLSPLPFFPKTSEDIAKRLLNTKKPTTPEAAVQAARAKFDPSTMADAPPSEGQDPYVALCFRHEHPLAPDDPRDLAELIEWAKRVWEPVLENLVKGTP